MYFFNLFGKPLIFAALLTWAFFGTYKGTAVQDDFTWMIGILVAIVGVAQQSRILNMQEQINELRRDLEGVKERLMGKSL